LAPGPLSPQNPSVVVLLALRACLTERLLFHVGRERILSCLGATTFVEADGFAVPEGPDLVTLVEGTVSTDEHVRALVRARVHSRWLVACGDCAQESSGHELPVSRFVPVDASVTGCPIRLEELLTTLATLAARKPSFPEPIAFLKLPASRPVAAS
jgi:coenzyme F420-reducing hydrogenase gamma subunit